MDFGLSASGGGNGVDLVGENGGFANAFAGVFKSVRVCDIYRLSYEDISLVDSGALAAEFVVFGFGGVVFVGGVVRGFGRLKGVSCVPVKPFYHVVGIMEVLQGAPEIPVVNAGSHPDSWFGVGVRVVVVYHVELPGHQDNGGYEGQWVTLSDTTGGGEGRPKRGAKFYDPLGVDVEVVPGVGEWFGEADVYEHVSGEGGVEGVEEFVVVVRRHGGSELVQ